MAEAEPFCEHCQLPLAMCAHRLPVSRAGAARAVTLDVDWEALDELAEAGMTSPGRPFEARYHGRCAEGCGQRWEPGDMIAYTADGDLVHEECARW